MRFVVVTVFLALAQPANAACHHYTHWWYKTPQRCQVALARTSVLPKVRIAVPLTAAVDHPLSLPVSHETPWWGELRWEPAPEAWGELRARLILETLAQ